MTITLIGWTNHLIWIAYAIKVQNISQFTLKKEKQLTIETKLKKKNENYVQINRKSTWMNNSNYPKQEVLSIY